MTAKKPYPVKLWHLLIAAVILSVAVTLWSAEFYVAEYPGREERGFPLPWKTIYGGYDVRVDNSMLTFDLFVWWLIFVAVIVVAFKLMGWKP
jgi:hypothetical protein